MPSEEVKQFTTALLGDKKLKALWQLYFKEPGRSSNKSMRKKAFDIAFEEKVVELLAANNMVFEGVDKAKAIRKLSQEFEENQIHLKVLESRQVKADVKEAAKKGMGIINKDDD